MITLYPYIRITTTGPHIAVDSGGSWATKTIQAGLYSYSWLLSAINAALFGTGGQVQAADGGRRTKNSGTKDLILAEGPESEKLARALGWYDAGGDWFYQVLPDGTPVSPGETRESISFCTVPLPSYSGLIYDGPSLDGTRHDRGVLAASDAGLVGAIMTASRNDVELTLTGVPSAAVGGYDSGGDVLTWIPQVQYALSPAWRGCTDFVLHDSSTSRSRMYRLRELIGPDDIEPMGELKQYWRIKLRCVRV